MSNLLGKLRAQLRQCNFSQWAGGICHRDALLWRRVFYMQRDSLGRRGRSRQHGCHNRFRRLALAAIYQLVHQGSDTKQDQGQGDQGAKDIAGVFLHFR